MGIQEGCQTFLCAAKQRACLLRRKLLPRPCFSSPHSDSNKKRMKVRSGREGTVDEIRYSNASDIMENRYLVYFNRPADYGDIKLSASSGNCNYCQPLSTIPECQGRKSPSPSTAYPSRPKVSDSNVKGPKINETSIRRSKSVFMAQFSVSSHNYASASGILGVLQSLQITQDRIIYTARSARLNKLFKKIKSSD